MALFRIQKSVSSVSFEGNLWICFVTSHRIRLCFVSYSSLKISLVQVFPWCFDYYDLVFFFLHSQSVVKSEWIQKKGKNKPELNWVACIFFIDVSFLWCIVQLIAISNGHYHRSVLVEPNVNHLHLDEQCEVWTISIYVDISSISRILSIGCSSNHHIADAFLSFFLCVFTFKILHHDEMKLRKENTQAPYFSYRNKFLWKLRWVLCDFINVILWFKNNI